MVRCQASRAPHLANRVRCPASIHIRHQVEATRAKRRATKEVRRRDLQVDKATVSSLPSIKHTGSKGVSTAALRHPLRRAGGRETFLLSFLSSACVERKYVAMER